MLVRAEGLAPVWAGAEHAELPEGMKAGAISLPGKAAKTLLDTAGWSFWISEVAVEGVQGKF